MTRLPEFIGKPIEVTPEIGFIAGTFADSALREYQEIARKDYNDVKVLDVLRYDECDVLGGSNPFAAVLMNQVLRDSGLRIARPSDLEKAMRANKINPKIGLKLTNNYVDSGLVLKNTNSPPNQYLAKDLDKQIRGRQHPKYPLMIPLTELEIIRDLNSPYELSFELKRNAKIIYAPILNESGNFKETDENGLPTKLYHNSSRELTRIHNGLSGMCLTKRTGIDAYSYDLQDSGPTGRIVVVNEK